jgi:nucleoside 2-deoxyribosyltransferase
VKIIYIAGKYRGPNAWAVEQNIRAAEEVAAKVWAAGLVALCPHANARHMLEGVCSEEHALAGTLELMRRCDAVVLVPNWRDSAGARAEVAEAMRLGLPIIYAWGDECYFADILAALRISGEAACKVDYSEVDVSQEEDFWTWGAIP